VGLSGEASEGCSSIVFLRLLAGLAGTSITMRSTKFLGKIPSFCSPEALSVNSPKYQSSSSIPVTVMIASAGKLRSSSCGELYSNSALTLKGGVSEAAMDYAPAAGCFRYFVSILFMFRGWTRCRIIGVCR
jgi:hypothetical protein